MASEQRETLNSIGLLILRAGVGGFLAYHGWGKLQMVIDGQFDQFGSVIGLSPHAGLILCMLAEFGCSLLVIVGLLTRLAAAPVVFNMAVAVFVAHAANPWSSETAAKAFFAGTSKDWFSKEPAMLYLIPFLALMFTGPGRLSIDALIWPRAGRRHDLPTAEGAAKA